MDYKKKLRIERFFDEWFLATGNEGDKASETIIVGCASNN